MTIRLAAILSYVLGALACFIAGLVQLLFPRLWWPPFIVLLLGLYLLAWVLPARNRTTASAATNFLLLRWDATGPVPTVPPRECLHDSALEAMSARAGGTDDGSLFDRFRCRQCGTEWDSVTVPDHVRTRVESGWN